MARKIMNTITYNGRKITSVFTRQEMRKALTVGERADTDAAAAASGIPYPIVQKLMRDANLTDRYGRKMQVEDHLDLEFIDPNPPKKTDAFISFYKGERNRSFHFSSAAIYHLGIEKGAKFDVAQDKSNSDLHFYLCFNDTGSIQVVTGADRLSFNAIGLVRRLGLDEVNETVRFQLATEPRKQNGIDIYLATLEDQ